MSKNADSTNQVFDLIFDQIFPHRIRLAQGADIQEVRLWLDRRLHSPLVNYTWRGQREIAFKDPRLAMEFKLLYG